MHACWPARDACCVFELLIGNTCGLPRVSAHFIRVSSLLSGFGCHHSSAPLSSGTPRSILVGSWSAVVSQIATDSCGRYDPRVIIKAYKHRGGNILLRAASATVLVGLATAFNLTS